MKTGLLCLSLIVALGATARAQGDAPVTLCANAFQVALLDRLDAQNALPGQTFRFRTVAATNIEGVNVPAGALGKGVIHEVDAAANHNRDGRLNLNARYIYDRRQVDVMVDPHYPALWSPTTPEIQKALRDVPVPEVAIPEKVIGEFEKGKNLVLPVGFTFAVIPLSNIEHVTNVCPSS